MHLKQNEEDEYHIVSAHYIRVSGEAGRSERERKQKGNGGREDETNLFPSLLRPPFLSPSLPPSLPCFRLAPCSLPPSLPPAQSALLIMDSEGYISIYTLPDLQLICREDCVDASNAVGQKIFICTPIGLILHQRSPSEFTRESITEESKLNIDFSVPLKTVTPLMLTPTTPKHNLVEELPSPIEAQVRRNLLLFISLNIF